MKMNKINILYFFALALFFLNSCEEDHMEKELYFKQVYLVGAAQNVVTFDLMYADEPQQAYISVGTGGSQNIDKAVSVTLTHNDATIDWYNNKYMIDMPVMYRRLEASHYNIPSMSTIIKAGEVYSRLPFEVETQNLNCDSLYALTFKIESVSEYQTNVEDTVVILNFNLVNKYSGSYVLDASKYTVSQDGDEEILTLTSTLFNITKTLKAIDKNSIRFFNGSASDSYLNYSTMPAYWSSLENNGVVFVPKGDNFIAKSWKNLNIVNEGECTYKNGKFSFWYDYMEGNTHCRLIGTLTK